MQLDSFWMSFVKGHARACTALAMAVIIMDHFPDAAAFDAAGGGNILESLKIIRVRVAIVNQDLMAVAVKNALLAHRGSIRQAHDVLAWIQKLEKVSAATGQNPEDVLLKWNAQCPSDAKVGGNKRLCCMNILKGLDAKCRGLLIDHFSNFGAKGAFTDDAFVSKKILPGYKPRMSTPRWTRLLTVSHDSFLLMLRHVISKHESAADNARFKVVKQKMERTSEMASLVMGIADDVMDMHPTLPRADIENTFIDGFIKNDPNLLMALESALTGAQQHGDKSFDVMSLPVLSDLILEWRQKLVLDDTEQAPVLRMKVGATELEEHEFKLWELRVMHDVDLFVSWCKVMKDRDTQMYYKKIQHNNFRAAECRGAAHSLFDPTHMNYCVTLIPRTDERSFLVAVAKVKDHLAKKLLIEATDVFTLCFVNWTAMSLFNAKMTMLQHGALASLVVAADANSLGLALMPTHSYRRGQLHNSISQAQSTIANHGLNIDRSVCFHYSRPSDARNERPLLIMGSVVLPNAHLEKDNKFVKCIAKHPVICIGEQLRAKDLVILDDPNLDALPQSIEVNDSPSTMEKHNQLGYHACGKILSACVDDIFSGDVRCAVLLVDLSVHVGDMIKAVANAGFSRPLMCVGLCDSPEHADFVQSEITHFLKTKLLTEDGFKIPGFTVPPKDAPMDAIYVPTPELTALGWHDNTIMIKESDRKKWGLHCSFQAQFNELATTLEQANAHCKPAFQHNNVDTAVKQESVEPPHKKLKTDKGADSLPESLTFIDAASIDTAILHDLTLHSQYPCGKARPSSNSLVLKICANHDLYLVNAAKTAAEVKQDNDNKGTTITDKDNDKGVTDEDKDKANTVTIKHGSMLVGYHKGKWQTDCSGDAKEIRYAVQHSSDGVIYNGHLTTVGKLVSQKRLTAASDDARCCYHDIFDDPTDEDKAAFLLRPTATVFYVVADVPVKHEDQRRSPQHVPPKEIMPLACQAHAGSLISPEHWNTDFTKVHWIVKWQPKKGLQPIRPQVTWTGLDAAIPPSKGLLLTPVKKTVA